MIGELPASIAAKSSPTADRKNTVPLAPAAMMSPFAALTTLFKGLGTLCTDTPSPTVCQMRIVPSYPALMTLAPSGENATPLTFWPLPSSTRGAPPASGHKRTVRSHDADASVLPSGETASATTGAAWPSSTRSGDGLPAVQIAICASPPAVTMRPSLSQATAFTGPSWKRITCSATLRDSDQRIADVSKLPEITWRPSGEIASARTAPPWPRNCARAVLHPAAKSATKAAAPNAHQTNVRLDLSREAI